MRYLLDTNIILFLILGELDKLSKETKEILEDNTNVLYVSTISLLEIIQLYNIGKIKSRKHKTSFEIINAIEKDFFITTLDFSKQHAQYLATLKPLHNDPLDHAIISQAISQKIALVSSDTKFKHYTTQNLKFAFNKI